MQFPPPPSVSPQDLSTAISSVAPMGPYTVATLPTPDASNLGRVATVTDLFGDRYSRVRCERVGSFYFWQPLSSDSGKAYTLTGDLAVKALTHPQSLIFSGAPGLGQTWTVTVDLTGSWPGRVVEMLSTAGVILGALNIAGLGLGSAVAVLAGSYRKFVVVETSPGVLGLTRLV